MKKKEFKGLDLISYDVDMNVQELTSLASRIIETRGKATKKPAPSVFNQIEAPDNQLNQEMYNEIIKKVKQVLPSSSESNKRGVSSQGKFPIVSLGSRHRKEVDTLLDDSIVARIPMNKGFKESTLLEQSPETLEKCFKDEYASRYLERMGLSVTQRNLKIVHNILPISNCVAHKHRTQNNELYLTFSPSPLLAKNQSISAITATGGATSSKTDYEYRVMELMSTEMKRLNFDPLFERIKRKKKLKEMEQNTEECEQKGDELEETEKKGGVVTDEGKLAVPKFDEYKKYIYPYNLIREKFMLDGNDEELEVSIYDLRKIDKEKYKQNRIERRVVAASENININNSNINQSNLQTTQTSSFNSSLKRSSSKKDNRVSKSNMPPRSRSVMSKISKREEDISYSIIDPHSFDEKELEKMPHLSSFEIVELQNSFFEEFPFEKWNWISDKQKHSIAKDLTDINLTAFIKVFIEFCYWVFLKEFAKDQDHDIEDLEKRLLTTYSALMDDLIKYRTNRMKLTTNHPIVLLCIRVTTESTFRICYQGFGKTKYFSIFCSKMSSLVSFLFDPESDVLSKLPPIECKFSTIIIESLTYFKANIKERKIVEKLTRISRKNEMTTTKSRANTVSPVMTNVLLTSPLRDKNMDFANNVSKKLIRLVGNIFTDEMRTKLMNVYMKKFK